MPMIFNVSAKSLTFLLALGAASTTAGSNLRQRRALTLFNHNHGSSTEKSNEDASTVSKKNLRSPTASSLSSLANSDSEDATIVEQSSSSSSATTLTSSPSPPSLTLNKSIYTESESITVSFSVGPPSHPYYSSPDAPSLNLDHNYPQWSIGLFMRDADPQGGTLSPIVSINVCCANEDGCDVDDRSYRSYNELSVTFGFWNEHAQVMQGQWPLEVSNYGTGFDAYVLDGKGAAAIGPLEFYIQNEFDEDVDVNIKNKKVGVASYQPLSGSNVDSSSSSATTTSNHVVKSGLMKYNKGTKKATARQHAAVAKSTISKPVKVYNTKIVEGNGVELVPESSVAPATMMTESKVTAGPPSENTIAPDKEEYQEDESISINFSIDNTSVDLSKYKIGIFMRMANPQGGELNPVVSLPLLLNNDSSSPTIITGAVTFSSETMDKMTGSSWPMDLYEWGTGFDAYVLDENGKDVLGPTKFNIMMNDTY